MFVNKEDLKSSMRAIPNKKCKKKLKKKRESSNSKISMESIIKLVEENSIKEIEELSKRYGFNLMEGLESLNLNKKEERTMTNKNVNITLPFCILYLKINVME